MADRQPRDGGLHRCNSAPVSNRRGLFEPVPEGGDWRGNAMIGGPWEDDATLAAGFLEAADILVEHWCARPTDTLVVPIFLNYRHGIELALKDAIRSGAKCLRRDQHNDPAIQRHVLEQRLMRTHSIGELASTLNGYLGCLRLGDDSRLDPDTQEALDSLHALDANGQAFRYSTVKTGSGKNTKIVPARPDLQHVNLPATAQALHDAGTLVLQGVSTQLYVYEEYQQEMAEQAEVW